MVIVTFILAFWCSLVVSLVAFYLTSHWLRYLPILEVCFGIGPILISRRIGDELFLLRLLPIGCYVKHDDENCGGTPPFWKSTIVNLSACMFLFLLAATIHGFTEAANQLISGFGQFVFGALHPSTYGKDLIRDAAKYISSHSFVATFGTVAAKSSSHNLLPLPILNGGMVLLQGAKTVAHISIERQQSIMIWSLFIYILMAILWLMAVYYAW